MAGVAVGEPLVVQAHEGEQGRVEVVLVAAAVGESKIRAIGPPGLKNKAILTKFGLAVACDRSAVPRIRVKLDLKSTIGFHSPQPWA
jgi:hypothetical protein